MNLFYAKFRLIFLPYLIITVCTIAIYTFLNWLLIVKLNTFQLDDDVANIIIPIALPWIPLLIWLRPRIKLLQLNTSGRRNPIGGILYLTWIAIAAPLVIAQSYMATATGKLTPLTYASDINNVPPTKYYTVQNFYVNKRMVHVKTTFSVSGKYNGNFNMNIYAAVPVFDHLFPDTNRIAILRNSVNAKALVIINGKLSNMTQLKKLPADSIKRMRIVNPSIVMPMYGDTGKYGALAVETRGFKVKNEQPFTKIAPALWLAVKYSKTISNHLSLKEKDTRYHKFALQSSAAFLGQRFDNFTYLNRIPYSNDLKNYNSAVTLRGDVVDGAKTILLPVFKPFEDRNGYQLVWLLGSFIIGSGIFLLILHFNQLKENAEY